MAAAKGSIQGFTDLECWHWHAYDYAFRRVFLGISDKRSLIDPEGDWFSTKLVDEAEHWLRRRHRMSAPKQYSAATRADEIRDDCRKIPQSQLTDLEREFLAPGLEAMMRRAKANLTAAEAKWRTAFRGPQSTHYEAPHQPAQLADVTIKDPALVRQARERLGIRLPYADDEADASAHG